MTGTENVACIAAIGEASRLAKLEMSKLLIHYLSLKLRFVQLLNEKLSDSVNFV
jgi:cysteine sulfinate desulfinase/cysteine desulfurase-like protein